MPASSLGLLPGISHGVVSSPSRQQKDRSIAWFGLERTFKDHLVQPPAMGRDIFH